ncbi:MAG: SDR family oxidoreductase [Pseudodesulfovibrio sp.]
MNKKAAGDHLQSEQNEAASALFDVRDRVVVITGGLGQLGTRFAGALLRQGARVALLDVGEPGVGHAAMLGGGRARYFHGDVTDRASIECALAAIENVWGAPYGLINNAALDSPPGAAASENLPFERFPADVWDRTMDVNVKGVFQCCQVMGEAMCEAGRGSVINVCSIYGLVSPDQRLYEYRREQGEPFYKPISYTASKSALLGMTRYLATYWAGRGVRVNTLTLGGVFNNQDPRFLERYVERVPLGRMADPDEYNGAVVFLMSDASLYMTGGNMVMDGGWTAW